MEQLIVTLEEGSIASDIKKFIRNIRGVASVRKQKEKVNKKTVQAIQDALNGNTVHCGTAEDFIKFVHEV